MSKRCTILALFAIVSLLGLTACAYIPPVQQGNVLSEADLHSVHRGMTERAVVKKLGGPVLNNVYPDGRVIYIYTLQLGHKPMHKRELVIVFRSGHVIDYTVKNASVKMPD